jgi:hypothetical protein
MFFTNPSDTLHYNGSEIGGVKKGDNLTTVVEKLLSEVDRLNYELAAMSRQTTSGSMSTDSLENKNSFGANSGFKDSSYSAKITVTPKSNSIEVFYDLNEIGSGERTYSRVVIDGYRNSVSTILLDSDKMSSGFLLGPDAFPATMSIEVRRKSETGEMLVYTGSVPLSITMQSGNYPVFTKTLNQSDLKTQTDVNNFLYKEIVSIQNSIKNSITTPDGSKTVSQAVMELKTEIEDVKSRDLSSSTIVYKNGDGNVSKTLKEALSEISDSLNSLNSN